MQTQTHLNQTKRAPMQKQSKTHAQQHTTHTTKTNTVQQHCHTRKQTQNNSNTSKYKNNNQTVIETKTNTETAYEGQHISHRAYFLGFPVKGNIHEYPQPSPYVKLRQGRPHAPFACPTKKHVKVCTKCRIV